MIQIPVVNISLTSYFTKTHLQISCGNDVVLLTLFSFICTEYPIYFPIYDYTAVSYKFLGSRSFYRS